MAVISLKDVSEDLHYALKLAALANRQTLREYLIEHLTVLANSKKAKARD